MRLLGLFSASSLITALTGDVTFLLGNLGVLPGASCLMLATVSLQKPRMASVHWYMQCAFAMGPVLDSLSQLNRDIERIRLILNGDSVVDWSRLHCHTLDVVDALLLRVGLDVKTELNRVRLRRLHLQAIEYLDAHQFDLTADRIRSISDPRNLLLWASDEADIDQLEACAVLKVMHIIHHASGRDLLHRLEGADR